MYWVTVDIKYMDGTKTYRRFDTWDDAGSWISNLADGDKMPEQIIMNLVWS